MRGACKRLAGGADLAVATPGRLLELVQHRGSVRLSSLGALVVDEAGRMMSDVGFEKDLRRLVG